MSWSKSHPRATPTTCPSSVPSRNGSVCFGRPSRFEPPAPRTSPQVKSGMREGVLAAVAAEVHGLPVPLRGGGAGADGDGHPAHGVDRGLLLLQRAPDLNDAREDR